MAITTRIVSQKRHGQWLHMVYEERKKFPFILNFFFSRLVNIEAKYAIIHNRIVNMAGDCNP